MTNEIRELEIHLQEKCRLVNVSSSSGWVNGNLYKDSNEFIGILPIPIEVQQEYGMQRFDKSLHQHQKQSFLAEQQNTRHPVLPIVEPEEKQLFHRLTGQDAIFQHSCTTNCNIAAKQWNDTADQATNIHYKVFIWAFILNIS
jgi:hypothetical protein